MGLNKREQLPSGITTIRQVSRGDVGAVSRLIDEVWQSDDFKVGPLILSVLQEETEGVVLGAFRDDELVGLKLVLLADTDLHHSHIMGVKKERRGDGIATELLKEHIRLAREKGIQGIKLTIDPFNYQSDYLYLHNAGAVVKDPYEFDKYGNVGGINGDLPTDRFVVFLHVGHPEVEQFLNGEIKETKKEEISKDDLIVYPGVGQEVIQTFAEGVKISEKESLLSAYYPSNDHVYIGMPDDVHTLEKVDAPKALMWKKIVGEVFDHYLSNGYIVEDLLNVQGSYYYKITKIASLGKNKKYLHVKDKVQEETKKTNRVKLIAGISLLVMCTLFAKFHKGFKEHLYNTLSYENKALLEKYQSITNDTLVYTGTKKHRDVDLIGSLDHIEERIRKQIDHCKTVYGIDDEHEAMLRPIITFKMFSDSTHLVELLHERGIEGHTSPWVNDRYSFFSTGLRQDEIAQQQLSFVGNEDGPYAHFDAYLPMMQNTTHYYDNDLFEQVGEQERELDIHDVDIPPSGDGREGCIHIGIGYTNSGDKLDVYEYNDMLVASFPHANDASPKVMWGHLFVDHFLQQRYLTRGLALQIAEGILTRMNYDKNPVDVWSSLSPHSISSEIEQVLEKYALEGINYSHLYDDPAGRESFIDEVILKDEALLEHYLQEGIDIQGGEIASNYGSMIRTYIQYGKRIDPIYM